mgnify:CR=1 FL=1
MIRVRIPDAPSTGEVLSLDSDQSHHLSVVLRVRPGDAVTALTSQGTRWICEVVDASGVSSSESHNFRKLAANASKYRYSGGSR